MFDIILDIFQLLVLGLIVYQQFRLKNKELKPLKKDKYEDYRDPSTGRLKGNKVGL
jgi:hypothetical protein